MSLFLYYVFTVAAKEIEVREGSEKSGYIFLKIT